MLASLLHYDSLFTKQTLDSSRLTQSESWYILTEADSSSSEVSEWHIALDRGLQYL